MGGRNTRLARRLPEEEYPIYLQRALIKDPELRKRADIPPWHKDFNEIFGSGYQNQNAIVVGVWTSGASGVIWDEDGFKHYPSTWDALEVAVREEIKWLVEKANEFLRTFPASYNHISVRNGPEGNLIIKQETSPHTWTKPTFG